jgi:hypothetical protein
MTTERRAATRRFAFKGRDHGGPLARTATQPQNERTTSARSRGDRHSLTQDRGRNAWATDFPTDFPTATAAIEESLQTARFRPPPVPVSKTGYRDLPVRGFESLPLRYRARARSFNAQPLGLSGPITAPALGLRAPTSPQLPHTPSSTMRKRSGRVAAHLNNSQDRRKSFPTGLSMQTGQTKHRLCRRFASERICARSSCAVRDGPDFPTTSSTARSARAGSTAGNSRTRARPAHSSAVGWDRPPARGAHDLPLTGSRGSRPRE